MTNRFELNFDGLDKIIQQFEGQDARLRPATEAALKATHAYVTPKLEAAIAPHRRTGRTAGSLRGDAATSWASSWQASIPVGFSIHGGGLASVFLMWGTPRIPRDSRLHAAVFGAATKRAVADIQKKVFTETLGLS